MSQERVPSIQRRAGYNIARPDQPSGQQPRRRPRPYDAAKRAQGDPDPAIEHVVARGVCPTYAGSADLVEAAASRDGDAWRALIDQHGRVLLSIARAQGFCDADAADVVQTVWTRLFEHIGDIRNPDRIGSWLATTTRHECARLWRKRRREVPLTDPGMLEMVADEADALRGVDAHDRDAQLWAAVATLPPRQQELVGRLMSDPAPSYAELAADLGMPLGSIGPNRQRCLRALRAKCIDAAIALG